MPTEMTYEQFKEYMARYEAEKRALPVSDWAKKVWSEAVKKGILSDTMPRSPLTREQAAEIISRMMEGR